MEQVKIGILGLGNISGIYLENLTKVFKEAKIAGVYDLIPEKVEEACEKYEIPKKGYQSMEELLADPEIEIVLNLTRPFEHYETTRAALLAGKHVYSEKPLATTYEEGKELVALAEENGLLLGGAPDTYLGAGIQTCRRLIDAGFIGRPVAAHAHMMCHGHESWHPSPEFYYQNGGGPMMDMGPYYVTALVNLLGRVKGLMGSASKSFATRTITSQPKAGKIVEVEVPTHLNGILDFENGAVGTITTSFDVYSDDGCRLEIYGTEGTIKVPDPNGFGGPIYLYRKEDGEFKEMPLVYDYPENSRGLGLADMAKALQTGRTPRADCQQTLHVLEIMTAVEKSSQEKRYVDLESEYERKPGMAQNLVKGILD
ncbi:MAG: Gfo/Idh/MocA family oxidoreductase [Clostridiales bacterium]|nr:Gfo/Idh/MocA family oxidoreductase [Clostridiales bacterium]